MAVVVVVVVVIRKAISRSPHPLEERSRLLSSTLIDFAAPTKFAVWWKINSLPAVTHCRLVVVWSTEKPLSMWKKWSDLRSIRSRSDFRLMVGARGHKNKSQPTLAQPPGRWINDGWSLPPTRHRHHHLVAALDDNACDSHRDYGRGEEGGGRERKTRKHEYKY